jgi:hypothetical protein
LSSSSVEQQEHIASDVTQARPLIFSSVSFFVRLCVLGSTRRHERLIVLHVRATISSAHRMDASDRTQANRRQGRVDARIVGKVEAYQPLCSVKDRSALRSDFFPPLVTQLVREFRIQMPHYLFQLAYCFWIN